MPAKLRSLSGEEIVRILARFGFQVISQRGSHVKLRRLAESGHKQTLHIPLHSELRRGTLHAIYQQALMYIADADLRPHFFTD